LGLPDPDPSTNKGKKARKTLISVIFFTFFLLFFYL
jgi:hypothetical protein